MLSAKSAETSLAVVDGVSLDDAGRRGSVYGAYTSENLAMTLVVVGAPCSRT